MTIKVKVLAIFGVLFCLNFQSAAVWAQESAKYPDYSAHYVGPDRFKNFNRKIFNFNSKLNKYAIKPVHIVWASVMPKYGMDRIQSVHNNIVYPRRLVSTLLQKDFKSSGKETVRFLTNTTVGIGGLYDPAKKFLKIEPVDEDMEQALAKLKVKSGPYLVIPVISSSSPRDAAGRILDWSLDPSSYIATPVLAIVKAALTVNRTAYIQPLVQMVESTYADPYEIAKKLYGVETYIKTANLDRKEVLEVASKLLEEQIEEKNEVPVSEVLKGGTHTEEFRQRNRKTAPIPLKADLVLPGYNAQCPVTDSMRTALFDLPEVNKSIWSELSVWNRSFASRIKTGSVKLYPNRQKYQYRYIMQKDKSSPIAIIYPSIGEGIYSHHSVVLAKMFYDEGYSVLIQGSHFQWEFIKSMPENYKPGLPANDALYLKNATSEIIASLQSKYRCEFKDKVLIGTSFGAMTALFLANEEYQNSTLNISKYISINPPVDLVYAMRQIDKNTSEWNKNPEDLKKRVAITAAKVVQVADMKDNTKSTIETLPFSEEESKLITGFIMHQKLSDLIFTLENAPKTKKSDIYKTINNMDYEDYANKYLLTREEKSVNDIAFKASLNSISNFLKNSENYKIYHSLDDYLVNANQLRILKNYTNNKSVFVEHGGHLGFLYRPEFIKELKKDITLEQPHKQDSPSIPSHM